MLRSLVSLFTLAAALTTVHAQGAATPRARQSTASKKPGVIVNLNSASQTELQQLPGIGPKAAARIIEYREHKGPFKKIEDLMNVQGIGEKSFLKLKPQITVGPNAVHASQD